MTAAVRTGTAADVAPIRALNDALLEVNYDDAFYASLFAPPSAGGAPCPLVFVAAAATGVGGELCGALSARLVEPPLGASGGGVWGWLCGRRRAPARGAYIMTLCVAPGARRRGVAGALVRALLAHVVALREVGDGAPVAFVELHVLSTNEAALALYAGLGFSRVRLVRDYYHFLGASHDAMLMRLRLEEGGEAAVEEEPARYFLDWLIEPLTRRSH